MTLPDMDFTDPLVSVVLSGVLFTFHFLSCNLRSVTFPGHDPPANLNVICLDAPAYRTMLTA
jgi:hypothetical protein